MQINLTGFIIVVILFLIFQNFKKIGDSWPIPSTADLFVAQQTLCKI